MNEKFFDLKKAKQDRMINGAMKVFAVNGYRRASTDDMVKEAEVSKGLWFHYFGSKLGLYTFIVDYAVKYMLYELTSNVNNEEKDYYKLTEQIVQSKLAVRKQYPYIPLLLQSILKEDEIEVLQEIGEFRQAYIDKLASIYEQADYKLFREDIDMEPLNVTMQYTLDGMLLDAYKNDSFVETAYRRSVTEFLKMMRGLTYN